MSFTDQIKNADVPEVKGRSTELPRIWWHNGNRQAKTPGSFYTKQTEFISGLDAPWGQEERFEGETGYSTTMLRIALLAYRTQPFREVQTAEQKYPVREFAAKWEPGMKLYTEVLCFIEGYSDIVIWASDGLTGKAISGKGGIIRTYETGMLAEAERLAGQPLPLWSFWLPISTRRNGDKIAYEDTGFGSFVTPPALILPEHALDTLYIGNDALTRGGAIMRQYEKWAMTRRLPENVAEGEVISVAQLPAPRNQPIPITDEI